METPEVAPQGQPQVEPTPSPAPAPTTAPVSAQPEPQPTKYGGKSVEELQRELEEKDRYFSEVNERAARAEHEALLTRNLMEQFARDRGRTQEDVPDVPQVSDDEFLTSPAKATAKIVEAQFARERAERERERVSQYVNTARSAYEVGKAEALKANPNLFRGIEPDISREILNNVQSSLKAGAPVEADILRNPRYWEAAAVAMRIMNGEDVSKYYTRTHNPMTPAHQETPSAGGPPRAANQLTPEQEALIATGTVTREQFLESLGKVRSAAAERQR